MKRTWLMHRSSRRRLALLSLLALALGFAAPQSFAAAAPVSQSGYIPISDGTMLRYTVLRPAGSGHFPVAMNYEGYCAGSGATKCNDTQLSTMLLTAGYAVLGVNARGTGCSTGTFDFRSPVMSTDGAAAVTWAARQSWSNGKVGLYGDSFPGLTQPGIAALHPRGLAAIAPFQIVDDVYRDVGYPGGIFDSEFASFWGLGDQPASSASSIKNEDQAAAQAECASHQSTRAPGNVETNIFTTGSKHTWYDAYWRSKEVGLSARQIDVPVLGCVTWQDDEVGSRAGWTLFSRIRPQRLWMIGSNGEHGLCDQNNPTINHQLIRYFDRFVRGAHNGFEQTPRVQIWHESHHRPGTTEDVPTWVTTFPAWPPATRPTPLYLRSAAALSPAGPPAAETGDSYQAPWPSAGTENGVVLGQDGRLWSKPVPPGGAVAWTTPALRSDTEAFGSASADLWLASTGTDTDLQVTITEVRPDGQETYVARGWLRASHRKLSNAQSTPTRPYQTHLAADSAPLVAGTPTAVRVEIYPFDHVFRAGSSVRLVVDTPSQTGGWNFSTLATPVTNTVLHDAAHPSRLMLGLLQNGTAKAPLPGCGTLLNQPCRSNAYSVPTGDVALP